MTHDVLVLLALWFCHVASISHSEHGVSTDPHLWLSAYLFPSALLQTLLQGDLWPHAGCWRLHEGTRGTHHGLSHALFRLSGEEGALYIQEAFHV